MFYNQTFFIQQSNALRLRVPELESGAVFADMHVDTAGVFFYNGQPLKELALPLKLAGNRIEHITLEL